MVLIYSKDVDDFVNQVIDCLEEDFVRFNETDEITIEKIEFCNKAGAFIIKTNYLENINLQNVKSIWFNGGGINSSGDAYEDKCYEILTDAYLLQKTVPKIGKRIADFEINRLDVMIEAQTQGLKIPHTLITGNKNELENFFSLYKNNNGIIAKRILDGYFYEDEEYSYNFNLTFSITSEILNKVPDDFAISFFQERIMADFEIRVIYIDGVIYSACIYSYEDSVDYRTKLWKMENLRIVPFLLPADIEEKLKKVFKKFNLNYGSADFIYSNDEYYFLEINPAGQISFINNACNFYIENLVAEILKNEK